MSLLPKGLQEIGACDSTDYCSHDVDVGAAERQVNYTEFSGMLTATQGTPGESWFSGVSGEMGAAERQVNYTEFAGMLTAAQGTQHTGPLPRKRKMQPKRKSRMIMV